MSNHTSQELKEIGKKYQARFDALTKKLEQLNAEHASINEDSIEADVLMAQISGIYQARERFEEERAAFFDAIESGWDGD